MNTVLISRPAEFERKKQAIRAGGSSLLHVVADFDKTFTHAFWDGKKHNSLIELIRTHNYISPEYSKEAFALFDKYHPMEFDANLDLETKKKMMQEWWTTHGRVMAKHGMTKEVVDRVVNEQPIYFREGLRKFLDTLDDRHVPILIFSASVSNFLEGFLKKEHLWKRNIHIVSNRFVFNEKGVTTGYDESLIIHTFNKDETALRGSAYSSLVASRTNVVLLGDTLGDATMTDGLPHNVVIKIGFLNEKIEENLPHYQKAFDVVILNDGPFDFVNELLSELLP